MRNTAIQTIPGNSLPWWHRERRLVVTVILLGLAIGAVGSLQFAPTEADFVGQSQYHTGS
jgi:hypothetical protein